MSNANKDSNPSEIPFSDLENMEEQVENKVANTAVEPGLESACSTPNCQCSVEDNENLTSSTTYFPYSGVPYRNYDTYGYTDFRPAGIMCFLLGLSRPRRMSAGHDGVSYGDEPQPESDPNLAPPTSYYRPVRQKKDLGQPSSLNTGFPKARSHPGSLRQRNQYENDLSLLLAQLFSISYPNVEEDIYDGPSITEIIDGESGSPETDLQSTSDSAKRTGLVKNKNTGIQKNTLVQQSSVRIETDKNSTDNDKAEKEEKEGQNDKTAYVLGSKNNDQELSESSCKKIKSSGQRKTVPIDERGFRRKRNDPSKADNRYGYLHEELLQRCLSVSPEESNVPCIVNKCQSRSKAEETSTPFVDKCDEDNPIPPSFKGLHLDLKDNLEEEEGSREGKYRSNGRQTTVRGDGCKTEIKPSVLESNRSVVNIEQTGREDNEKNKTNEKDVLTVGQPELGQLNDTMSLNAPENQTPTKPRRNKNATEKTPSFAGQYTNTDVSSPVRSGSKISSPNFTSSSYQSDYAGSGSYPFQRYSGDRLSNLSDAMLEKGMTVKDVYPDGNCLFAAIVDQLRVRGEFFFTPKSLRQAAVRYLREHPNQADGTPLFEFVSNHENLTWEGYLKRLNRDGEWADHIIISAISSVLRRQIVIHSILKAGKQVNETVVKPDLIGTSRERELPIKTDDDQIQMISVKGNARKITRTEEKSQKELLEDLQLGHIPEAHYVSLRYLDWQENLYTTLKKRKDDPTSHLRAYGHKPNRESNDSSSDSNEDLSGQIPTQHFCCLPNTHFNFLLKYLQDGNFLETCEYYKHWHGKFRCGFENLFTIWGVGDRFNELESYLVTKQVEKSPFDRNDNPVAWYIVFSDETVVSKQGNTRGLKQLVPDETGCKLGYLKLKPVNPTLWRQNVREENGNYYLKHLYFQTKRKGNTNVPIHVTFKCDWPEAALECKERMIRFPIKGDEGLNVMTQKVVEGVRVVPICSDNYTCRDADCLEWKYSFSVIEYVLCKTIITCNARFCFQIMEHFLGFVFCGKNIINKELQKSVFFYTCDELDIGNNDPDFLRIFSYYMLRLELCLEERSIPDFFLRAKNLIEQVDEKDISWHYERVCLVRSQYLIYIFFFLDQNGLLEHFKLSKCFDTLLSDAYKVAPNPVQCSKKLSVMVAREWVVAQRYKFHKAKRIIDNLKPNVTSSEEYTESECDLLADTPVSTELHKRVMKGLPLQEQWLYAFFLEIETGISFLEHVCKEQKCEKLQNFFGESVIQILITDKKTENPYIELPVDIAQQEGIARFAVKFGEVLREQMFDSSAYIAGIHFFLSQHAESLLDSFDDSQKHGESRVPFDSIVLPLINLFLGLHSQYLNRGRRIDFLDLMSSFERLCDYTQYVTDYELLAQLWVFFGDKERASTAMMKANSLRKK